jgi:hypothetical protein
VKERRFQCNFCGKQFVHEERFMAHKCEQMKRAEEFRTPIGQAGWIFYQKWMKAHRRQVPRSDAFLHSKFYKPFIRFARFVKQVNMPDVDLFIWLMKEKDMSPVMWVNDQVYAIYLEFLDRKADPYKRADTTINMLLDIAEAAECDVSEVFDVINGPEFIQMLRERRLSPWILLRSRKFKQFLTQKVSTEEMTIIQAIIRPPYWKEKFDQKKDVVVDMDRFVKELNL